MSITPGDINDNEIRIITSTQSKNENTNRRRARRNRRLWIIIAGVLALLIMAVTSLLIFSAGDEIEEHSDTAVNDADVKVSSAAPVINKGYVSVTDTVVNGVSITILTPEDAVATLAVGPKTVDEKDVAMIVQAADIRGDNGEIVGMFVVDGVVEGRGESKSGFCSIINNNITIGAADATPMLEEALAHNGCFFRQYPLVVGGQVVENKPKGKSYRRALAETETGICVIVSNDRLTFHEFSQTLVTLGVRNAIYLVGGNTYGRYRTKDGKDVELGENAYTGYRNINFLLWK